MLFFWIIFIIVIVALLFRYTTIPYAAILQFWNTSRDIEGIIQPFLKVVIYESRDAQSIDPVMEAHEQVHIRQINELGSWTFIYQYVIELIKNGYRNNKFEVEAKEISEKQVNNRYTRDY